MMNCLGSYRHFHREQTDALAVYVLARLRWPWVCCDSDIAKFLLQAARVPRCWQLGSVWNESRGGGKISKPDWSQLLSLMRFHVSERGDLYLRLRICPSGFKLIMCTSACACGLPPLWVCTHSRSFKHTFHLETFLWQRQRTVPIIKKHLFGEYNLLQGRLLQANHFHPQHHQGSSFLFGFVSMEHACCLKSCS